jgi:prolyl 4-hydroxylase
MIMSIELAMNLIDYCIVVDDGLHPSLCDQLIELFQNNAQLHERFDHNKKPNLTQFNFTRNIKTNEALHDHIAESAMSAIKYYKFKVPDSNYFPPKYGFEEFRVKRYTNDDIDQFDTHVDSVSMQSSKRFLIFFWYLNDVDVGGETELTNIGLKISPKKGRLIMFPPFWNFPHYIP